MRNRKISSGKENKLRQKPKNTLKVLIGLGRELKMGDMRKEIKSARKDAKRDVVR